MYTLRDRLGRRSLHLLLGGWMVRTAAEATKVTICVWHPFTQWRPPAAMESRCRSGGRRCAWCSCRTTSACRKNCRIRIFLWGTRWRGQPAPGCKAIEVDPFNGGGCGAVDVSGTARFRHRGDKSERNFLRADGGAHHGIAAGAGAKFSRFRAAPGKKLLGAAEIWDQPQH